MAEIVHQEKQIVMRTLSDEELIRIVRAQPSHFHPDDVACAQVEAERRQLTPLLENLAAQDAEGRSPLKEKGWEISWQIAAAAFFSQMLKETFKHWIEYKLAYAVAFAVAWTFSYWLIPRKRRTLSFWKWSLLCLGLSVVLYLFFIFGRHFWPSAFPVN